MLSQLNFKLYLEELKKHSKYNFCGYSESSIHRRIEKVLIDQNMTLDELLVKTKCDASFVDNLVDDITVNTTDLFRNSDAWEYLFKQGYKKYKNKPSINIWHAGCSTGQEVFSNLILLNELGLLHKVNLVATDLNSKVIANARKGEYSYKLNKGYINSYDDMMLSLAQTTSSFSDYFDVDESKDLIKVKDFILTKPKFIRHDLVEQDIPFVQKFDLIFCRNVLIYFDGDLQTKVVKKFYEKLNPKGSLIIGSHEALHSTFKTKFSKKGSMYIKNNIFQSKYV